MNGASKHPFTSTRRMGTAAPRQTFPLAQPQQKWLFGKPKQQAKYSIDANGRQEKERKSKSGGKAGSAPSAVSWMINFQAQPRSPQARRRQLRLAPPLPPTAVLSDGQIKGRSKPRWQVPISFVLPHLYPLMKVGVESRAESQSDASHPESQALKL